MAPICGVEDGGRCIAKRGSGAPGQSGGRAQGWWLGAVCAIQRARARYQQVRPPECGRGRSKGLGVTPAELTRSWVDRGPGWTAGAYQAGGAATIRGECRRT